MATPEDIRLYPTGNLDDLEREIVRDMIGISGTAGSAVYVESETRMGALTPFQRQLVRYYINTEVSIDTDTTRIEGGQDALDLDPERDRIRIVQKLRRILYPTSFNDPLINTGNGPQRGYISFVPVGYNNGSQDFD